ncbi:MAG: invasion associated locus B family protein [Pseudomonadota bacterium]
MIAKFNSFAAAAALVAGGFAFATPQAAHAQRAATPSWVKICSRVGETDICNVQYSILTGTGQLVTAVNLLQSKGKTTRRLFQVAVPSGRIIPQGIKMQIDNGKENTLPYSLCIPDRCLAEIPLSEGLVKAMKAGGEITLTSTNFRVQKNPVKVSLKGFTAAFDGPPLKRDEVANRNKALQDALREKTKAAADKLKAAQEAAKQGSN